MFIVSGLNGSDILSDVLHEEIGALRYVTLVFVFVLLVVPFSELFSAVISYFTGSFFF
jgi:hypothetical protein